MDNLSLKWEPIALKAKDLIQLLRKHRNDGIIIHFFYQESAYQTGVKVENNRTIFFLDDDEYSSMLVYSSSACIEGMLISDMTDDIVVFAINSKDPAMFLD